MFGVFVVVLVFEGAGERRSGFRRAVAGIIIVIIVPEDLQHFVVDDRPLSLTSLVETDVIAESGAAGGGRRRHMDRCR